MTSRFDAAVSIIIGDEGVWSNDPDDSGGETKYGHDQASWPDALGRMPDAVRATMPAHVRDLTWAQAVAAYEAAYWDFVRGDDLPAPLALVLFDAVVNQGEGWAPPVFQEVVTAYPDGQIGPKTVAAANAADPIQAVGEFVWRRDQRYRQAGNWPEYGHGWITRLARTAALSTVYTEAPCPYLPHPGTPQH